MAGLSSLLMATKHSRYLSELTNPADKLANRGVVTSSIYCDIACLSESGSPAEPAS